MLSEAWLSDASHAAFDALYTSILLVATSLAVKPADEDHTYGHGKVESLGDLIGEIALLVLAVVITGLAALRVTAGACLRNACRR